MIQGPNNYEPIQWLQEIVSFENNRETTACFHEVIPTLKPTDYLLLNLRKTNEKTAPENIRLIKDIFFFYFLEKEIHERLLPPAELERELTNLVEKLKLRVFNLPTNSDFKKFWLDLIDKTPITDYANPEGVAKLRRFNSRISLFKHIFELERDSELYDNKRPTAITDLLHGTKIDIQTVEEYIDYLELIKEEGEVDPKHTSFTTLTEEPTLIDMRGKFYTQGGFGTIQQHDAKHFASSGTIESKSYITKLYKTGFSQTAEEVYARYKKLWDKLSPEERKYVLPLVSVEMEPAIEGRLKFKSMITEKFIGNLLSSVARGLPIESKNEIAYSLIKSLYILLHHGHILPDIKENNMIYTRRNERFMAVLCDYDGLTDMRNILQNPTPQAIIKLHSNISIWHPTHLPFHEYLAGKNLLKKIIRAYHTLDLLTIKQHLQIIDNLFIKIQQFCLGSVLFGYFTGTPPYKSMSCSAYGNDCPSNFKTYSTPNTFAPNLPNFEEALKAVGCDNGIIKSILEMIQPKHQNRLSLDGMGDIVNSFTQLKLNHD